MKNIKNSSNRILYLSVLCLSIFCVSFKIESKSSNLGKNVNYSFFDYALPCGMSSKGLLHVDIPEHYIYTRTPQPILSASGLWDIAFGVDYPTNIPTQIVAGNCKLVLQTDGNLVIYHGSQGIWASNTVGSGAQFLFFQTDGNLVLAQDPRGAYPVWSSNIHTTCSGGELTRMRFQSDGNLIILYPKDSNYDYDLGDTGSGAFVNSPHYGSIN
jgi:hypothetical protein